MLSFTHLGVIMKRSLLIIPLLSTLVSAEVPPLKPKNQSSFVQSQYIPDISLIVDASLVGRNRTQDELSTLNVPGLIESFYTGASHDGHEHGALNGNNGFNLNYAELVLSSNVDPYFALDAVFHFGEEGVEIEEAYFTTTALGYGTRIRGGKFLSEFGRMNKQHHHTWDFNDAPLVYSAFLGPEGLSDVGLQFHYVLPIEPYVMAGLEVMQGRSETSFGNESIDVNGTTFDAPTPPSLAIAYLKTSFELGNTTFLPGISYAYGSTQKQHTHNGVEEGFSGHTSLYDAELTIKHYFNSYSYLQFQSEWMMRVQKGSAIEAGIPNNNIEDQIIRQSGLYAQLIYAQDQNWHYGLRYDNIYQNEFEVDGDYPPTPYQRYTLMSEYHFSEFSRLRLQYDYNSAVYSQDETTGIYQQEDVQTLMLSFNFAIGAHAAHSF